MSAGTLVQTTLDRDHTFGLEAPRSGFLAAIRTVFATFLTRVEDALFELAQTNQSEYERGVFFDAIRELRLGREAIDRRFFDRLTSCWQALERGEGPLSRQLGGNDLDEALALTAAVRRAETECADALRSMRASLALIVGVPDGDEILGPRQVFGAFEAAFRDTLIEPSVRRVVMMFFERHVGAAVPGIYRELAAALDRLATAPKPGQATKGVDLPALDALVSDAGERGDLDLSALIQQALAGGNGAAGSEATKLLATLQQHDQPGSRSRSASIDLARFATRTADNTAGDSSQQIVLDMVALLFDGVFNDSAVPVSARLCIARLQIPFLRLALRDRAMLARRSHLGRRFFDQLIAVTRGWQEPPTPQQRQVLEALIDSVGEACMDDHRAFAVAAETGLLDLRTLALPAADAALGAQAQRRALTTRAEAELNERRQQVGRLPDPVDTFLSTHWLQYLVDCIDSHGPEASPWRQALATVDALLWSISPKEGAAQQRLAELRPRMTRRLRQGMDEVGVSMFEQEAFLETLETILDRAQAGQPVWDWEQESVIDELLGVNERVELSPGAVSVVELDKPVPPVRLVAQQPARPIPAPPALVVEDVDSSAAFVEEETISIEELAAEVSSEDIALLELPILAGAADVAPVRDVDGVHEAIEIVDELATGIEYTSGGAGDAAVDDAADADVTVMDEAADDGAVEADDYQPQQACSSNDGAKQPAQESTDYLAAPANSLEALMRRRGLSAVAHVEEVEVTDRGGRG